MLHVRVDVPEPVFAGLDFRYDAKLHRLSYKPEPLDLLALQEIAPGGLERPSEQNMLDLFIVWYAQWRTRGGKRVPALDVALLAPAELEVRCRPREPRGRFARLLRNPGADRGFPGPDRGFPGADGQSAA